MRERQCTALFLFFLLFLVSACLGLSYAQPEDVEELLEVSISEKGKIISFYDEFFIFQVTGLVYVRNPSESPLYDISIPLSFDGLDLYSSDSSAEAYISSSNLYIMQINPNQTIRLNYTIRGIIEKNILKGYNSLLERAILRSDMRIYAPLKVILKKAEIEDEEISGYNRRLISVRLENPSAFGYVVDSITLFKTPDIDITDQLSVWNLPNEENPVSEIGAYETYEYDVFDYDPEEGQVYWVKTDIYLKGIKLSSEANITLYTQDDLLEPEVNETEYLLNETLGDLMYKNFFVRRILSDNLALPGENMTVSILLSNFEPRMANITLYDSFPLGFSYVSGESFISAGENRSLQSAFSIPAKSIKRIQYELNYYDEDSFGLDYFPAARVRFMGEDYFSQSLPFIRKYLPEKKLFVQKKVEFLEGDKAKITLVLRNLGEDNLENLVVKEFLADLDSFVEVSEVFIEKGLWKIETLGRGSQWEVSYVTDSVEVLSSLPEIYGIPALSISKTIILSTAVRSRMMRSRLQAIEVIGIISIFVIAAIGLFPGRIKGVRRSDTIRQIEAINLELHRLKEQMAKYAEFHSQISSQGMQSPEMLSHKQEVSNKVAALNKKQEFLLKRKSLLEENLRVLEDLKKSSQRKKAQ
ncbi:MAG TPA: hypothetical protein ENN46_03515 [Candidatus Woesearchaeota archaeon]|nr:hypothetical protein [Candidatus Woesearchaeota archaeon]